MRLDNNPRVRPMTGKRYTNRWLEGEEFLSVHTAKAHLSDLVSFLQHAQFPYSVGTPPADLVVAAIKEILIYSVSLFNGSLMDIRSRNLEMKIINSPERFHTLMGTRYIDTGLSRNVTFGRTPKYFQSAEVFQEFFENVLQDLIDVENILIEKSQKIADLEELEALLEVRRRKPIPQSLPLPSEREIALRLNLLASQGEILSLQRKLKSITTKFYQKRTKSRPATRKSRQNKPHKFYN